MSALQLLKQIEWLYVHEHRSICLYCGAEERQGHKPDCELEAVLTGKERDGMREELHRLRREIAAYKAQESMRGGREQLVK